MEMYPPQTLKGNTHGWVNTGIRVYKGDVLQLSASGIIKFGNLPFTNGFPRDPDGRDEYGKTERAEGAWPATGFIRNSLVLKIGNTILQGGSSSSFQIKETGMLMMCNNDNFVSDNSGSWTVNFSVQPGLRTLYQNILIIVQGKNSIAVEMKNQFISKQAQLFGNYCEKFTGGRLSLTIHTLVLEGFVINVFDKNNLPDLTNASLRSNIRAAALKRGFNLDNYHVFMMVFDELQNGKSPAIYGTWQGTRASAIPWWILPATAHGNNDLSEYLLHEYLHHMEYYFKKAGVTDFVDIHCWNGSNNIDPKKNTCIRAYNLQPAFAKSKIPGTKLDFYEGVMKWRDDGTHFRSVNYTKLDGIFGNL